MADIVKYIGTTVKKQDCFDMPPEVFLEEKFELTDEQKKAIKEIDNPHAIARWTETHQICGGTLKGDGYRKDQLFKCEKMSRLIDLCKEHKKIVVVCRYNNELEFIAKQLSTKRRVILINGKTKEKHLWIIEANRLEECLVLVNAACSEGYELPTFPIMVFYSYDFSLKNYIQMLGRIQRGNALQKCTYISLTVKNSIDEDVKQCVENKKSFDVAIYNK